MSDEKKEWSDVGMRVKALGAAMDIESPTTSAADMLFDAHSIYIFLKTGNTPVMEKAEDIA